MEINNATETSAETIAAQEGIKVVIPTEDDLEARNAALEAEKARLIEEASNYKVAYLKEKSKNKGDDEDAGTDGDERLRQITREELANSKIAQIAYEQDQIIKKALKENKELKLAQMNKTGAPAASIGAHSEAAPVRDTLVTPDQMAAFKARGWNDKDIERYKKNIQRLAR